MTALYFILTAVASACLGALVAIWLAFAIVKSIDNSMKPNYWKKTPAWKVWK